MQLTSEALFENCLSYEVFSLPGLRLMHNLWGTLRVLGDLGDSDNKSNWLREGVPSETQRHGVRCALGSGTPSTVCRTLGLSREPSAKMSTLLSLWFLANPSWPGFPDLCLLGDVRTTAFNDF